MIVAQKEARYDRKEWGRKAKRGLSCLSTSFCSWPNNKSSPHNTNYPSWQPPSYTPVMSLPHHTSLPSVNYDASEHLYRSLWSRYPPLVSITPPTPTHPIHIAHAHRRSPMGNENYPGDQSLLTVYRSRASNWRDWMVTCTRRRHLRRA